MAFSLLLRNFLQNFLNEKNIRVVLFQFHSQNITFDLLLGTITMCF